MTISSSTKYIDTGISWIGTIPSDWQMVSLKSIAWVILGKMRQDKPASKEDTLEKYLCAKDVHLDGINWYEPKEMYFSPKEKRALLVKDGDLLIVEGGAGAGGAYVAKNPITENFYVQNSINIVRAHKCVLPQYLYYWVNKLVTNGYVEVACNVATIPHFTKEKVSSIQIPLPSLDVQQRIVSYLDSHISSIDKRMSLLATKRDLYLRLKTAIINCAVTQGLNPDVKMKDSGVKWIGRIPEHWELERFKSLFTECKSVTETGQEDLLSVSEYYGIARRIDKMDDGEYESRADSLIGYKICKKDDLVINIMLAWKRGLGFSDFDGIVSPAYAVYRGKNIIPHYFHYLMRTDMYVAEYKRNSKGIIDSRLRMYTDRFNNIIAIVPPLSEQQVISTYLDEKCAKIDAIIENLNQQIDKHKLLKRALINEVITGQRAV